MEGIEKAQNSYYSIGYWDRLPSYLPCCIFGKVAEQQILTKCSECNTFQVKRDLMHDFINFNTLNIILKFIKNNCERSRYDTH